MHADQDLSDVGADAAGRCLPLRLRQQLRCPGYGLLAVWRRQRGVWPARRTAEPGISWHTVGLGFAMWAIAAIWTMLTIRDVESDGCQVASPPGDPDDRPGAREVDDFDDIKKAH